MELILSNPGSWLGVENGQLAVHTEDGKRLFNPAKIRAISLAKGARISSDAIILAIENEIDILFTDRQGTPVGRVWSVKYGSISTIRKNQIQFFYSEDATEWVKKLVQEKMKNQISILHAFPVHEKREENIIRTITRAIKDYIQKVGSIEGQFVSDIIPTLRGWEGIASKKYFQGINLFLPQEFQTEQRTKNPARDPFNSMLNYAYGILYSRVEGALIKAGLDPYVGIYHRDEYNRPALVYDIVEKYRWWMDYVVISLARSGEFSNDCYYYDDYGACWLEPIGRRILAQAAIEYLEEIVTLNGKKRSRSEHIQLYAHSFAKTLLKYGQQKFI